MAQRDESWFIAECHRQSMSVRTLIENNVSLSIFHSYCVEYVVWKKLFSSSTEAFLNTQCNCTSIGSCSAIKTNQWLEGGVERVYGYAAHHSGLWLYKRPLRRRISDFFSSVTKTLPRWLFANVEIRSWNDSTAGLDLLKRSAYRSGQFPAAIRRRSKRASQKS